MTAATCLCARSRLSAVARAFTVAAGTLALIALAATPALARPDFTPSLVLSDSNMRDYQSMSQSDIQAFLNSKPGPLKRMSFARHDGGSIAPASAIIWEASQAWHISPKVLLTLLQKEQSLITRRTLAKQTLNRAVGAGCPDSGGNRYPGFGNQLWHAARLLDGYGEVSGTTPYVPAPWTPGMANKFTRSVPTSDLATYKLYVYNPSIGARAPYGDLSKQSCAGNANFWKIHWAYFGDPLAERQTGALAGTDVATSSITLAAPSSKSLVGAPVLLQGRLVSADASVSVAGALVRLEQPNGAGWTPISGTQRAVDASGSFAFALRTDRLERVRVAFDGGAGLSPSVSGCFVSEIVPVLTSPVVSGRSARRPVRISGAVAPAHTSSVKVYVYRVKRGKRGLWRTFSVGTRASGAWSMKAKVPKGTWAVRALHNDSGHAAAYSPWTAVKVR